MIGEVEDYAILMLDRNGVIRNWNKGAEKIKGYTEEEAVGMHFRMFYRLEDRETGLPEQLIDLAAREGKATHEGWRVERMAPPSGAVSSLPRFTPPTARSSDSPRSPAT